MSLQTPVPSLNVSQAVLVGRAKLISESGLSMHIVADGLYSPPTKGSVSEKIPSGLREMVRLAIPAAQQKEQGLVRQFRDRMLAGVRNDFVGQAGISHDSTAGNFYSPWRRNQARAGVIETVAVCRLGNPGVGRQ